jgi:hypothetical protein
VAHHAGHLLRAAYVALLGVHFCACARASGDSAGAARDGATPLGSHVSWTRSITLQENRNVVNVLIRAVADSSGGFLVSDEQEDQIRRYDSSGRLYTAFGRRGSGPGEFTYLTAAGRLPSGGVVAVDAMSRGALFDRAGRVVRTFRVPVGPVKFAMPVGDTLLLLGGTLADPRGGDPDARLHLWDLRSGRLLRSFLPVRPRTGAHRFAANTAGLIGADVRGDTIAAVFALSDTVYLFDLQGRRLGAVPITARGLRRFDPAIRLPRMDLVSAREWFARFSLVCDVFWLRDGFLVQYQDRVGVEPRWRLARMSRDGRTRWESADTPHLLAVDRATETLWFVHPGSPTPNVWSAARLRD